MTAWWRRKNIQSAPRMLQRSLWNHLKIIYTLECPEIIPQKSATFKSKRDLVREYSNAKNIKTTHLYEYLTECWRRIPNVSTAVVLASMGSSDRARTWYIVVSNHCESYPWYLFKYLKTSIWFLQFLLGKSYDCWNQITKTRRCHYKPHNNQWKFLLIMKLCL
jgi:hypothetical protein